MLTFDMSYPAVLSGRVESAALDQANIFDMRVMRGLMPIAVLFDANVLRQAV